MVAVSKVSPVFPENHLRVRAQNHTHRLRAKRCSKSSGRSNLRRRIYDGGDQLESCSRDPIGFGGEQRSWLAFVHNNPFGSLDPSGLCPEDGPSAADCNTAIKILEQFERLWKKLKNKPMDRKLADQLKKLRDAGTIRVSDLPGILQRGYPGGELDGLTLDEVRAKCGKPKPQNPPNDPAPNPNPIVPMILTSPPSGPAIPPVKPPTVPPRNPWRLPALIPSFPLFIMPMIDPFEGQSPWGPGGPIA